MLGPPRGHALIVAPELVDHEIPAGSLVVHELLHEGDDARLERGALVLERPDERRGTREARRASTRAIPNSGSVRARFDGTASTRIDC